MPVVEVAGRNEAVTDVLFQQGVLLHLFIGRWTANKKMAERDLLLDEIDHEVVYLGHKKLLPKEAGANLQRLESQARSYLASHSLDFPIAGARFIFHRTLPEVVAKLRGFRAEWDDEVDRLIQGYPEFQRQQLERMDAQAQKRVEEEVQKYPPEMRQLKAQEFVEWLNEQRRLNWELYPPVQEIPYRYSFRWRLFQVSDVGQSPLAAVDEDMIIDAQQAIRQDFQRWVQEASVEMHRQLGQAAANARRMLEANGRISPRSLRPLFEAFETFKSVAMSNDSSFQRMIDQVRQRYLVADAQGSADYQATAERVNNSTEELGELLGTFSSLAQDEVARQAAAEALQQGDFGRVVRI